MRDAHDPRDFRSWVSLDETGAVTATHEFVSSEDQPLPEVVEVTALGPQDWTKVADVTMRPIRLEHDILVAETAAAEIVAADKRNAVK